MNEIELKDKLLNDLNGVDGVYYDFKFFNQDTYDVPTE